MSRSPCHPTAAFRASARLKDLEKLPWGLLPERTYKSGPLDNRKGEGMQDDGVGRQPGAACVWDLQPACRPGKHELGAPE